MKETEFDVLEALNYIPCSECTYEEWVEVGMALKFGGYSYSVWDNWSRNDQRYKGECERKWDTFDNSKGTVVSLGTIYHMAKSRGYRKVRNEAFGWEDTIGGKILEGYEIEELRIPERKWTFAERRRQIRDYLSTLFEADEYVGYVVDYYDNGEKMLPKKGSCSRTAGQLMDELSKTDQIEKVFGDYSEDVGAWIRFNPLDGKGVKNENVTAYRFALVESDTLSLSEQYTLMKELELPIACLVYSGGKSVHAIVRVDAETQYEYKQRVKYLYEVCKKNGLIIDEQNKNESRLSRFPGFMRKGKKQYLIDTNIGKKNWDEWFEYVESVNDDLPDIISLDFDNLPETAPPLIDGILRKGHKMLIAGASKAGKSFALIELTLAIATGSKWMNTFQCHQGKVLYVNLELDTASCANRFNEVCNALGMSDEEKKDAAKMYRVWNLRGSSQRLDILTPKLIRRAEKEKYMAIIIDPIYKVLTGDENNASEMSEFCNQFDKICTKLNCSAIYCHHHSKGKQEGKSSIDRASGSGVFARDPDALLDMIEIPLDEEGQHLLHDAVEREIICEYLDRFGKSTDETLDMEQLRTYARKSLSEKTYASIREDLEERETHLHAVSAWKIESTLREFEKYPDTNVFFKYPIHRPDDYGVIDTMLSHQNNGANWKVNGLGEGRKPKATYQEEFEFAYYNAKNLDGKKGVTIDDIAQGTNRKPYTIRRWLKENRIKGFALLNELVKETKEDD